MQPIEELRARIGLSGLSEVMRQEGPPVAPAGRTPAHSVPRNNPGGASTRSGASSAHGRAGAGPDKRSIVLYAFAGFGLCAFLAIVVFLLTLLVKEWSSKHADAANPGGPGTHQPALEQDAEAEVDADADPEDPAAAAPSAARRSGRPGAGLYA